MSSPIAPRAGLGTVALTALAIGAFSLAAPPDAEAGKPITAYRVNSVECVPAPSGNVQARVTVTMRVVNYGGLNDWAKHMKAKARFETGKAGSNLQRNWSQTMKSKYLVKDHSYRELFVLNVTDAVNPDTDQWKVHVKMTWDRAFPTRDIVKNAIVDFNAGCASTDWDPTAA